MSQAASLLVVDDEPEICEILVEYFNNQGFVIHSACDSASAREVIATQAPDLAILDIRMPGEDGLSLARWIRDQHRSVGIIMLTTAADVMTRSWAWRSVRMTMYPNLSICVNCWPASRACCVAVMKPRNPPALRDVSVSACAISTWACTSCLIRMDTNYP